LKAVQVADHSYECGGSIIHPSNQLVSDLVQEMGLNKRNPGPDARLTMLGPSNQVVFQQWPYLQAFQLIYRLERLKMLSFTICELG